MARKTEQTQTNKLYRAELTEFYKSIYALGFNEAERQYKKAMRNLRRAHQLEIDVLNKTLHGYEAAFRETANELANLDANNPLAFIKLSLEEAEYLSKIAGYNTVLGSKLREMVRQARRIKIKFKE